MKIFQKIGGFFRKASGSFKLRRYEGAVVDRLTSKWLTTNKTLDAELRMDLKTLRARCRQLANNNDYAKRFLKMVVVQVLGSSGIKMQSDVKNFDGTPDDLANTRINEGWKSWGKLTDSPSMCGSLSWKDIENLTLESVVRDGEVIVVKHLVDGVLKLQIMEADFLDEDYNTERRMDGTSIKMGVEVDMYDKPVAYHFLQANPADTTYFYAGRNYVRIPAERVIHLFVKERASQSRGVPWMHSAMTRLNMLGGYEEAELVSARVASAKMGFFTTEAGSEGYGGTGTDGAGNPITEAEPGTFEQLPTGVDFKTFDPDHPSGNFQAFMKAVLRGIASGLNVSYNSLASDLEGVNYSSIRQGVLDERDNWRTIQRWLEEHLCELVFRDWLLYAITSGEVKLPATKFDKFNSPKWMPRGWGWVDPVRDTDANIKAVNAGFKSRADVVAEQGKDLAETFEQLEAEEKMAEEHGLSFKAEALPKEALDEIDKEDEDEEDEAKKGKGGVADAKKD